MPDDSHPFKSSAIRSKNLSVTYFLFNNYVNIPTRLGCVPLVRAWEQVAHNLCSIPARRHLFTSKVLLVYLQISTISHISMVSNMHLGPLISVVICWQN